MGQVLRHDQALYEVYNCTQKHPLERNARALNFFTTIMRGFGANFLAKLKEKAHKRMF